jgi:uncharacterized membrane protein YeaQ/YmgE (transglycosylase-associated protein family)
MLRRIGIGLLFAFVAYLIGAFGGGYLVSLLSTNQHDKEMEAAMTGAFVFGPLAAIVGFVIGMVRSSRGASAKTRNSDVSA